jgi:hypothetical protein
VRRMRVVQFILMQFVWIAGIPLASAVGFDANFIGNEIYMTTDDCKKFGGYQVVGGYPRVLGDAPPAPTGKPSVLKKSGFENSISSCHFTRIADVGQAKRWDVDFYCETSDGEPIKSATISRNDDGSLDFQVQGNQQTMHFVACETGVIIID